MQIGTFGETKLIGMIAGWVRAQGKRKRLVRGIWDDGATVRTSAKTFITTDALCSGKITKGLDNQWLSLFRHDLGPSPDFVFRVL